MISVLSKFRKASTTNADLSRDSAYATPGCSAIIHYATAPSSTSAASCGEGELHKKRTERGYVTGSGINISQPKCDGMAPAIIGFLIPILCGGKGAYAQKFTSDHRVESGKP